jgi:hypothetical protein
MLSFQPRRFPPIVHLPAVVLLLVDVGQHVDPRQHRTHFVREVVVGIVLDADVGVGQDFDEAGVDSSESLIVPHLRDCSLELLFLLGELFLILEMVVDLFVLAVSH